MKLFRDVLIDVVYVKGYLSTMRLTVKEALLLPKLSRLGEMNRLQLSRAYLYLVYQDSSDILCC